jgi:2-hydroxychromene-2-carboxylate isomerase
MRSVIWYFDFISPFAFICLRRLRELPADVAVEYRPVLFAGLLAHHGQKGPAEIPAKRQYTYRWSHWYAHSLGIPLKYPAGHPFNPLHHLRLAIAAGCTPEAVRRIFDAIWTTGADAADPAAFAALLNSLGVDKSQLAAPEAKNRLRRNTDEAAASGVFGVPTFEADGERFWGADSVGFLKAYLADRSVIDNEEMRRLDGLPVAAARRDS